MKFNIPECLGLLPVMQWQDNIHGMIRIIPSISPQDLESHFDFIHYKLTFYEKLKAWPLLELAIWKSKITEQHDGPNDLLTTEEMQVQCRVDSISMVMILVPNVMTYLFDKIKVYAKIPILFTPPSLHVNTILLYFVQLL